MSSTLKVDILQDSGGNNLVTSNGSGVITAAGFGKVGQVVSTNKTDVFSTTSTSYTDVTGLSVNITPTSTSSKILVRLITQASATNTASDNFIQLVRGSTSLMEAFVRTNSSTAEVRCDVLEQLDSPSSTSQQTYKAQMKVESQTGYINRKGSDTGYTGTSTIIAMEILP